MIGEAKETFAPDQAVFNFNVSAVKKSESESLQEMNRISAVLLEKLSGMGFTKEQLKLTDYSIDQEYDYSSGKTKVTGYKAYQNFELKFPINKEKILKIFETVTLGQEKGLTCSFSTSSSDSLVKAVNERLMVAAVLNAREKAELIAKTTDCSITSVANVNFNLDGGLRPMRGFEMADMAMESKMKIADSFSVADDQRTKYVLVKYNMVNK